MATASVLAYNKTMSQSSDIEKALNQLPAATHQGSLSVAPGIVHTVR
ncbi:MULTISPECIES: hypothetical protein [Marinobacter]|nr:hypothetical protein [Marinobacter salarius]WOI18495.1 hypothetical protein R1T46_17225 [Marinobacter salarius]